MSIISTIAKQEIFKVFKNKKMLTSIFFMPVVILIAMFAMTSIGMEESEESQTYQIYFLNMQVAEQEVETEDMTLQFISDSAASYEEFREGHQISENDMVIELREEEFQIYYDSLNSSAKSLLPMIKSSILKPYIEGMVLADQGIVKENFEIVTEDTSSELERKNRTVSLLLPYMMIIILFMNLVNVVGDSIAGEKERGTLSKQLLSPIDNSQMILGKLLGTTVIGMISSTVFFAVLMGGSYAANAWCGIDLLGIGDMTLEAGQLGIMFLGFSLIAMVFVAAIALMSSFAKTVKEATSMSLVIYYLVIIAALATGFSVGETPKIAYMIPVYNFSVFMHKLFIGSADMVNGIITVVSLVVTFGVLTVAVILNFKREKVIVA